MSKSITFKPKQLSKKIMSDLHDRAYDVIENRFGLSVDAEEKTLEAIGKKYGITRERVRQIENAAIASIKKSEAYKAENAAFEELKNLILSMGAIVPEKELLSAISKDPSTQNHIHFYLVLHDDFKEHKEDENFSTRWSVDDSIANEVHNSLKKLYSSLSDEDLIPESEMINRFISELKNLNTQYKNEEIAKRYLSMSKNIASNPLGEWGRAGSSNIKTRGIKDFAFLAMRKHGSPMHFREVAKSICDTFNKETHAATCHNELIKDKRFVLVGRGTYGLAEWGYKPGVVREVIKDILKKEGPMTKEAVVDRVMKERFLKRNTILVNLQNPKYFKKNKAGLYMPV